MLATLTTTLGQIEIDGELIALIAIAGGVAIPICAMVLCSVRSVLTANAKERSRREIAAYIAEGSMTPEEGERLLAAGAKDKGASRGCC